MDKQLGLGIVVYHFEIVFNFFLGLSPRQGVNNPLLDVISVKVMFYNVEYTYTTYSVILGTCPFSNRMH